MNRSKRLHFCLTIVFLLFVVQQTNEIELDCPELRMGQYLCPDPNVNHIDPKTQQPYGCTKDGKAKVWCIAVSDITCSQTKNSSFLKDIPCRYT